MSPIFLVGVAILMLTSVEVSSHNNQSTDISNSLLSYNLSLAISNHRVKTSGVAPDESILVDEALNLIAEGNRIILSAPIYEDIILAVGNTGAGKTTIVKFIAALNDLESYETNDGYLIRDRDGQISGNSTIVSQTIFPNLIIHSETNSSFYDLPGFSDTRNASVEIANTCFMKYVADHAQRVKVLFIVNYNSLRSGQSRTDFKMFLEHATAFIPNPKKFKSSMALVATKVEVKRSRDKIINGIALFLKSVKRDLNEVISDERKRKAAEELIDVLLSTDASGNYDRISYFKQPDEVGPLKELSDIMLQRAHILNVVYNSTNFTNSTPEDFGYSLSSGAKLLLNKVVNKMNENVSTKLANLTEKISNHYQSMIGSTSNVTYAQLWSLLQQTEESVHKLSASDSGAKFLEILKELLKLYPIQYELDLNEEIEAILKNQNVFEEISSQRFPAPIAAWTAPFTKLSQRLRGSVTEEGISINNQITATFISIGAELTSRFRTLTHHTGTTVPQMELTFNVLSKASRGLDNTIISLENSKTINEFFKIFQVNLPEIWWSDVVTINLWTEDVSIEGGTSLDPSVFSLASWVRPLEQLSTFLNKQRSELDVKIRGEKHRLEMEEAEQRRKREERKHRVHMHFQNEREVRVQKERERQARRNQERLNTMRQEHQREREWRERQLRDSYGRFTELWYNYERRVGRG